ncbi:MAG: divergent polysaccharide deacetylase family protein [Kiloniellales bacterium]
MSPSSKTTRSKTGKKAPAKRPAKQSAKAKSGSARTTKSKGSGRRPPSKRSPAKRKTTRKRAGTKRGSLLTRLGAGAVVLFLLLLAGLTFSWPDGEQAPQLAESEAAAPEPVTAAKSTKPKPVVETRAPAPADPKPPAEPKPEVKQAATQPSEAPPAIEVAVAPPKPAADPIWKRYSAAHTAKPGQPMIAIVLDDLGPNKQRSRNAIELPGPLTLAFLPYAKDLPALTAEARKHGHELLIHMPMEPKDLAGNNPGENALLTSLSDAEIQRRLDWAMQRFPGYVGLNNHMGSAFTADRRKMDLVMQRLAGKGGLFLDSVTSGASKGATAAKAAGIPSARRDIFLDHGGDDPGMVLQQLAKLEAVAKRQGYAVAIGHPHDGTVTALELWIPDALARGFALVPISALVEAPDAPDLRG